MHSNIFDRLAFLSLFLVIVLLPVFFLPFTSIPVETSKGLLLVSGLVLCLVSWAVARFFDCKISLPKSLSLLGGVGVVVAVFFSAFFSQASQVSFFGTILDIGTFWFIFGGFLLMLLSSIIFKDAKNAKLILFGTILSSIVVLIFQSARLFIPDALSFAVLGDKTANLVGSWNAFGIFAGFSVLMSLIVTEFFSTTRIEKLFLQALIILSMLLVAVVNFPFVWILLGVFSLIIFVYKVSLTSKKNSEGEKTHFPTFSFIVIMVSLLFFMSGNFIGSFLPNHFGLSNTEVSPSLSATMEVTKAVLKDHPVFGLGPNRFAEAWALYKSEAINGTLFWDVSFNSGSGLLPTFLATTGGLGILAFLIFFVLLVWSGVKSIFASIKHGTNWETMAFFVLSFYLFASCFFYSGGAVVFLLALAFAGIFIGLSSSSRANGEIEILFSNDHRKSFFSILFLVIVIVVSAAFSFKYIQRLASVSYFSRTLSATTMPIAEESIQKALSLYSNDLYMRTYAQVYLVKLGSLVEKGDALPEEEKPLVQASLDQAVSGAQGAVMYNPKNYLNFQALGSLYQTLASLGVKDSSSKAVEAYIAASTLNPKNPGLKLSIALAYNADKKVTEAKDFANAALTLKPDYIDALLVLSQIAQAEGDHTLAVSYAEQALALSPSNKDLIQYVDSLKNGTSSNNVVPPPVTTTESTNTTTTTPAKKN